MHHTCRLYVIKDLSFSSAFSIKGRKMHAWQITAGFSCGFILRFRIYVSNFKLLIFIQWTINDNNFLFFIDNVMLSIFTDVIAKKE